MLFEMTTMSEETARIYNRARSNGVSSDEAWEDIQEFAHDLDWDIEQILSTDESGVATSDQERPQ